MTARFYSVEECNRKADQHSEMCSMAASDGDQQDALKHANLADIWEQRAKDGGWLYEPN